MPSLLLLLLWPLVEIWLFMQVGQWLGPGLSLLLVIGTAILGLFLIQQQWQKLLISIQKRMFQQNTGAVDFYAGLSRGWAGLLLLIPGFASDLTALIFLTPLGKIILRRYLKLQPANPIYTTQSSSSTYTTSTYTTSSSTKTGQILEGEYTRKN